MVIWPNWISKPVKYANKGHSASNYISASKPQVNQSFPLTSYYRFTMSPFHDDDGPIRLPSGRLICSPHHLVVCHRCCVDYSFMDEILSDQDDNDESSSPSTESDWEEDERVNPFSLGPVIFAPGGPSGDLTRGTGRVLPTKFLPPSTSCKPKEMFISSRGPTATVPAPRMVRRNDPTQILLYTDGACQNNGQPNPRAAWACVFRPRHGTDKRSFSGRLETN